MKRTTIMLPLDLKARATSAARDRGISFGELVRRSLRTAIEAPQDGPGYDDPLYADGVVFEGDTPADLASDHDGYLYGSEGSSG
jgi:hypothetical protein